MYEHKLDECGASQQPPYADDISPCIMAYWGAYRLWWVSTTITMESRFVHKIHFIDAQSCRKHLITHTSRIQKGRKNAPFIFGVGVSCTQRHCIHLGNAVSFFIWPLGQLCSLHSPIQIWKSYIQAWITYMDEHRNQTLCNLRLLVNEFR